MKMVRALLFALAVGALFVGLKVLQERPPRKVVEFLAPQEQPGQVDAAFAHTERALDQEPPQRQGGARSPGKRRGGAGQSAVVRHAPTQATTGEPVIITAEFKSAKPVGDLTLQYQVVEPGQYIALKDSAFEKRWESAPMNDLGEGGDKSAGDGVFTVQLPGTVQKHRRLVRYRIGSGSEGKVIAPAEGDSQPNYAYFVYDGVPSWQGAINPKASDRKFRQPVTYAAQALERVPVYHLIGSKSAVEKATWSQGDGFGGGRNEYHYTGTLVYDGAVYDHIGFRARGGSWRHAMGKNMWKFNFLPGHRFQARDFYGKPYDAKWDKLNLGACIQQGDYGMRGEQGMFEAVGFRLFNLAGTEAPRTHWVHFRIIDEADESPADQYAGDFWGLYLAVENVDEHFLKEHDLPAGNLYKMEFGAKTAFNGNPAVPDQSDVRDFMRRTTRSQATESWVRDSIDLGRYYNYRSILECIHHYDIDSGKNYFYYLNPKSRKWAVIPWDIDLSWGDNMYGGGYEPFYRMGVISRPPHKHDYQERLAEIRDLLFNPDEAGKLIDEHARMISNPKGEPSMVDADRAKWDYHPVMASRRSMSGKAGQGLFYFRRPNNTFKEMVKYMKNYVAERSRWIDSQLLAGYRPPGSPAIVAPSSPDFSAAALPLKLRSAPPVPNARCQWRLAEVTDPTSPTFDPAKPWKYEIEALWRGEINAGEPANVPTKDLRPGKTYRVRARWQDGEGSWSRWSAPVQFTMTGP